MLTVLLQGALSMLLVLGGVFFLTATFYLMALYTNKISYLIKHGIKSGGAIKVSGCLCEGVRGLLGLLSYHHQVDTL